LLRNNVLPSLSYTIVATTMASAEVFQCLVAKAWGGDSQLKSRLHRNKHLVEVLAVKFQGLNNPILK
jgi:hypothetical protein